MAPCVLSQHFDEARVKAALAHLQLVFVGSSGRQTRLEQRALTMADLRLRPHVLFNYLTIRHALHAPEGVHAPDMAAISGIVKYAMDSVISTARHIPDDTAECYAQPSDIANVRDTAWTAEHADAETAATLEKMNGVPPPGEATRNAYTACPNLAECA